MVGSTEVVQAADGKQQIAPMLDKLAALPEVLGSPEILLADSGYFSEANVEACVTSQAMYAGTWSIRMADDLHQCLDISLKSRFTASCTMIYLNPSAACDLSDYHIGTGRESS